MRPRRPETVVLRISGPLARSDLPGLFARACALLGSHPEGELRCELCGVAPDAVAVDALARLALAARRQGRRVHLYQATTELVELVAFMGLTETLPVGDASPPGGAAARTAGRSSSSPGRT